MCQSEREGQAAVVERPDPIRASQPACPLNPKQPETLNPERQAAVLAADEEMARRQILQVVGETWSALQAAPTAIAAAQAAVVANERALADARLRYRAMVEPLTETLLVQRDLQAARASLLTTLTRQAIDRAVLVRELGADPPR